MTSSSRRTNSLRAWRCGSILAAALLLGSACGDSSTDPTRQVASGNNVDRDAGYQWGGPSTGKSGDRDDPDGGGFEGSDDPREGFYELTETLHNPDDCDPDAAEDEPTDYPFLLMRYEMSSHGPAYIGYLCEDTETCRADSAPSPWILIDVKVADAEELPALEDRATGALETFYYAAEWTDGQCIAWRLYDQADFVGDSVTLTSTRWSSLASEIVSEDTCTADVSRQLADDRFTCTAIDVWRADKI